MEKEEELSKKEKKEKVKEKASGSFTLSSLPLFDELKRVNARTILLGPLIPSPSFP